MKNKFFGLYIWELSLLIALCVSLCTGVWASSSQDKLASEVIRLHVVAESDTERDQAVKLRVRDAVLELLTPTLESIDSADDAREVIEKKLPEIEKCSNTVLLSSGFNIKATATLGNENFPTRNYTGFSLPCGEYISLIVTLGEGNGHNWWCVVYPPLCTAADTDDISITTLSDGCKDIIITDDNEPQIRFRIIEFYNKLSQQLS